MRTEVACVAALDLVAGLPKHFRLMSDRLGLSKATDWYG